MIRGALAAKQTEREAWLQLAVSSRLGWAGTLRLCNEKGLLASEEQTLST